MRVVVNGLTDLTPKFGARVYLHSLLPRLRNEGVEVCLLVGRGQTALLSAADQTHACEVDIPHRRSYWQLLYQSRINHAVHHQHAEVYHLPNSLPLLRKPAPTVITIHDLVDLRVRKYAWPRKLYRLVMNYLAAHVADHVLTGSESSKRDIVALLRIPKDKVTVAYNGVDESFRPLDRVACREFVRSHYSVDQDFLFAPGGLSRNKNVDGILRAFADLRAAGKTEHLVLTGETSGGGEKAVRDAIRRLGLQSHVTLAGYVPPAHLPKFYNACVVVVYPSFYEGFGLPVLEAMACGAPLVTSNTSAIPEVAGDAALLVDPNDHRAIAQAVERLLSDAELRSALIHRGLQRARQFTWERAAQVTCEVYRKVRRGEKDLP